MNAACVGICNSYKNTLSGHYVEMLNFKPGGT